PDRDELYRDLISSTLFNSDLSGEMNAPRAFFGWPIHKPLKWLSALIPRSVDQVNKALESLPHPHRHRVFILLVNTREEIVAGGEESAVHLLAQTLEAPFFPLDDVAAVHAPVVGPVLEKYTRFHTRTIAPQPQLKIYSCAWAKAIKQDSALIAESLAAQAVSGHRFPDLIEQAYEDGVRFFVEVGPGNSTTRMIKAILADRPHLAQSLASTAVDEGWTGLNRLLAELWLSGYPISPERIMLQPPPEPDPRYEVPINLAPPVVNWPIPEMDSVPAFTPDQPPSSPEDYLTWLESQTSREKKTSGKDVADKAQVPPPTDQSSAPVSAADEPAAGEPAEPTAEPVVVRPDFIPTATPRTYGVGPSRPDRFKGQTLETSKASWSKTKKIKESPDLTSGESIYPVKGPGKTIFNRTDCLEFAVGSIEKVLGPDYAVIDSFPSRVRLPDEPLMFVDRVTLIEGKPRSLTKGRLVTEHDLKADEWCLENGLLTPGMSIESGQADLMLSAYLGADLSTKGLANYRLLDAEVVFHSRLPKVGQTAAYDIRINNFFSHGDTLMFRFDFDGSVDGKPLLSMRKGCAGFFTPQALATGKGLSRRQPLKNPDSTDNRLKINRPNGNLLKNSETLETDSETKAAENKQEKIILEGTGSQDQNQTTAKISLGPFCRQPAESLDETALTALRNGDPSPLGPTFSRLSLTDPLLLPDGKLCLINRALTIDLKGGVFDLGFIRTEADIEPSAWYLTSHFKGDEVMPGTLMYDGCLQSLRLLLLTRGWLGPGQSVSFQPLLGLAQTLKCRGQVTPGTKKVSYEVHLKEVGLFNNSLNSEQTEITDELLSSSSAEPPKRPARKGRSSKTTDSDVESSFDSSIDSSIDSSGQSDSLSSLAFEPYAIAEAIMLADGRPIVEVNNLGLSLSGLSAAALMELWAEADKKPSKRKSSPAVKGKAAILVPPQTAKPVEELPVSPPLSPDLADSLTKAADRDKPEAQPEEQAPVVKTVRRTVKTPKIQADLPQDETPPDIPKDEPPAAGPAQAQAQAQAPQVDLEDSFRPTEQFVPEYFSSKEPFESDLPAEEAKDTTVVTRVVSPTAGGQSMIKVRTRRQPAGEATGEQKGTPSPVTSSTGQVSVRRQVKNQEVFDKERLTIMSIGILSQALGPIYSRFDQGAFVARLPRAPYDFIDRAVIKKGQLGQVSMGTQVEATYNLEDKPEERAWLLSQAGGQKPVIPYAAINEMALQSCGFLAAYMGSALPFSGPMHFRNLGGEATVFKTVDALKGQIQTRSTLTKSSVLGTMTIQHYQFSLSWDGQIVYEGQTHFGFHNPESLVKPQGIKANPGLLKALTAPIAQSQGKPFPKGSAWPKGPWRMVDNVISDIKGDGRVWGRIKVDPKAWFFTAHFPGDPVWPGSLGLEGFFQTAKALWAAMIKPEIPVQELSASWQAPVPGLSHRWLYRGQIVPRNQDVVYGLKVVNRKKDLLTLKGLLWVDGQVVYQIDDLTIDGKT
ncbi:MAG: hypothetical protein LBS44_01295, partial [Deltaproteobacteria bacterium]|nr:hypothetical protein [Deltaproteobacteria bacterium]